jgi:hypothetical protein
MLCRRLDSNLPSGKTDLMSAFMTPGSIVLWEKASGSLFTCDPGMRAARIANLKRLSELPVKTVYAGHFGRIGGAELPSFTMSATVQSSRRRSRSITMNGSALMHVFAGAIPTEVPD